MSQENIYQHFRKHEIEQVKFFESIVENVFQNDISYLTDFLNPRERYILQTIVNKYNLCYKEYGGFENAEQQRVYIYPEFYEISFNDFDLYFVQIKYPTKFATLTHRQILGTLLNNGIKRNQLGDIVNKNDIWQFVCTKHIYDYIKLNITKISNVGIDLELISHDNLIEHKFNLEEKRLTISSLRLDNIIANVYNIPRQTTKKLIQNEMCKINFTKTDKVSESLAVGDIISVRGYGRFYIDDLQGITKKGKNIVKIIKLK